MKIYVMDGLFVVYRLKHFPFGIITQNKGKKENDKRKLDEACLKNALYCRQLCIPRGYYFALTHNVIINRLAKLDDVSKLYKMRLSEDNDISKLQKYLSTEKCKKCSENCKRLYEKCLEERKEYVIVIKV